MADTDHDTHGTSSRTRSAASGTADSLGTAARYCWPAAAVVLYALALALGFWATGQGRYGSELGVDIALSHDRTGAATAVALWINTVLQPVGGLVIVGAACLLLPSRRGLPTALAFGSTVCAAWLPAALGKAVVDRARPPLDATHALVTELGTDSFPSGHTELAAALVLATVLVLARTPRTRLLVGAVGGVFTVVVAASRLYLGVHYPSDVIGSLPIATAGALLWTVLWRGIIGPLLARRFPGAAAAGGRTVGGRHV